MGKEMLSPAEVVPQIEKKAKVELEAKMEDPDDIC